MSLVTLFPNQVSSLSPHKEAQTFKQRFVLLLQEKCDTRISVDFAELAPFIEQVLFNGPQTCFLPHYDFQ